MSTITTILGSDQATNSRSVINTNFSNLNTDKYQSGDSPTFATTYSPILIGGTSTTSSLTYKTTTGVGTTGADHIFLVGNNGATEAMRILNNANVGIGTVAPGTTVEVVGTGFTGISIGRRTDATTASGLLYFDTSTASGVWTIQNNAGALSLLSGGTVGSNIGTAVLTLNASTSSMLLAGTATMGATNYAADAQASDTYVITLDPAPAAYTTGMQIIFKANTANTGAATLNVNGLGAKTIVKAVSTTLANNDILASMLCLCVYDGTNFVLMNPRAL